MKNLLKAVKRVRTCTSTLLCLLVACMLMTSGCVRRSSLVDYSENQGWRFQTPPPDKALVVFVRPSFVGHAISAAVYEDDQFVAIVMAHTHIGHLTEAGSHRYMVVSEAADFLDADLEGGKIYFAQVVPRMGIWRGRFSLAPITPQGKKWGELRGWLANSYQISPNEKGEAWNRNNYGSVIGKKDAYLPKWLRKTDKPVLRRENGVESF